MAISMMDLPLKASEDCRILIVDDDQTTLELYTKFLANDGFQVEWANDGEDALRQIRANPPDLVIADVVFGDPQTYPDGYEICRTVKSEFSEAFIPVILVTGFEKERVDGLAAGADDYLIKPVKGAELRVQARSLIRTKQLYEMVVLSRKELENRVYERTRELEEANLRLQELATMKSNTIQIISHELRTPLHRGRTALGLARMNHAESNPVYEEVFDTVERAFILLENRIEDIELFSDPAGIELDYHSIGDIILGAANQARILADDRVGEIDLQIGRDLPPVTVHARSIMKALAHLIHNGMKFSDYQVVTVSAANGGDGITLAVTDRGPGISEDIMKRLREPIKQEDTSTTRAYGGMGIGLALISLIFDQHGITPKLTSQPGKGTTISFTLPAANL